MFQRPCATIPSSGPWHTGLRGGTTCATPQPQKFRAVPYTFTMTLNWHKTASDCQVVLALAPIVSETFTVRPDLAWGTVPTRTGRSVKVPNSEVDNAIYEASQTLPDTPNWRRTRNRVLTRHGLYQIRRDLHNYLSPRSQRYRCLCGTGDCRFPVSEAPVAVDWESRLQQELNEAIQAPISDLLAD